MPRMMHNNFHLMLQAYHQLQWDRLDHSERFLRQKIFFPDFTHQILAKSGQILTKSGQILTLSPTRFNLFESLGVIKFFFFTPKV